MLASAIWQSHTNPYRHYFSDTHIQETENIILLSSNKSL